MHSIKIRLNVFAFILIACCCAQLEAEADSPAVARGEGFTIQQSEVEKAAESRLKELELDQLRVPARIKKQRHLILSETMKNLAAEKLLALEAAATGISVDELIERDITPRIKPLTQEELDRLYEINKGRQKGTREEIIDRINVYVLGQRKTEARKNYIEELALKYGVEYSMPPVRFDIATAGQPSFGPEDAAVTIVEFSDFECPHCSKAPAELHMVYQEFPDKVRIVFRQYPLWMIHPHSPKAAEASLCAAKQGKFWEMHNLLFSGQDKLGNEGLKEKASQLGLDREAFDACLDSGSCSAAVERDLEEGSIAGISATPAIFINGRPVETRITYDNIREIVLEELALRKQKQ